MVSKTILPQNCWIVSMHSGTNWLGALLELIWIGLSTMLASTQRQIEITLQTAFHAIASSLHSKGGEVLPQVSFLSR